MQPCGRGKNWFTTVYLRVRRMQTQTRARAHTHKLIIYQSYIISLHIQTHSYCGNWVNDIALNSALIDSAVNVFSYMRAKSLLEMAYCHIRKTIILSTVDIRIMFGEIIIFNRSAFHTRISCKGNQEWFDSYPSSVAEDQFASSNLPAGASHTW